MNLLRCPASVVVPVDSITLPVGSVLVPCWTLKQAAGLFFFTAKQAVNCLLNLAPLLFSAVDKVLMLKGCIYSQLILGHLV